MAQLGDTRTRRRFAWWPHRVRDGWVHLDWYESVERLEPDAGGWTAGQWLEVEAIRLTR